MNSNKSGVMESSECREERDTNIEQPELHGRYFINNNEQHFYFSKNSHSIEDNSRNNSIKEEYFETFQGEAEDKDEDKQPVKDEPMQALKRRLNSLLVSNNANANLEEKFILKQQLEDANMEAKLFKMVTI